MDHPLRQRRQGERRRLWDRRSPLPRRLDGERRLGERRREAQPTDTERRGGGDRRGDQRRNVADRRSGTSRRRGRRRRDTPIPYSPEQFEQLKERFAAPGPVSCPACGGVFTLGPARGRGAETTRSVFCLGCGRVAVVPTTKAVRVLLIEKRASVRWAISAALSGAGHDVVEAADAGVGLAAYETAPADVVLLDVHSPGRLDAAEFLRRLRRSFPEARVVTMAGRAGQAGGDPLAATQGLGAVSTLSLPASREDVLRAVDEARG